MKTKLLFAGALMLLAPLASAQPWQNTRLTVDLSTRFVYDAGSDKFASAQFVGVDSHTVFSGADGDIGTLLVQTYATKLNDIGARPHFFDDEDDGEVVYRMINFNLTAPFGRAANFRFGHIEIPFGLEAVINTNGTLRQYQHGPNLGLKGDWGVTMNGETRAFEYEVGLTRGSWNQWETEGDPHAWSGRVGTPRHRAWAVGLSGFTGDVYNPSVPGSVVDRHRVAVDAQWHWRRLSLMGELTGGEDNGVEIRRHLFEVDYAATDGGWFVYSQLRLTEIDGADAANVAIGASYSPDNSWTLSGEVRRDIDRMPGAKRQRALIAQLRYRF